MLRNPTSAKREVPCARLVRLSTFGELVYLTAKLLACQHQLSQKDFYHRVLDLAYSQITVLRPNMSVSNGHLLGRESGIRHILLSLSLALGLCSALAQKAKADFIGNFTGDYALTNFTLTNTDNGGFPSFTNGFCSLFNDPADPKGPCGRSNTPDGQQSLQLTGGNGGSGIAGITDLVITATASGIVAFRWGLHSGKQGRWFSRFYRTCFTRAPRWATTCNI